MTSILDAPDDIIVSNTSVLGEVLITWTNPSQIGMPAISNYSFSCSPSSGITFSSIIDLAYNTIYASGLTTGTKYIFSISVVNSAGTSPAGVSEIFTYLTIPSAPTSLSATPGNSQITLSWDETIVSGGLPITGYTITSVPPIKTVNLTAGIFSTIVTGLINGISYVFSITQNNSLGQSTPATITATPLSVPNPPTNIRIVSSPVTSGTATISWTNPVITGGSEITGYSISAFPSSGVTFSQPISNPTTINGLSLNTSYIFIISAINSRGSSRGGISEIYIYNRIPAPPTEVSVVNSGGNIIVNWPAVVMSEGLPVTGFVVTSTPLSVIFNVSYGIFSQTFTTLTPGVSYTFTVYTRNSLGISAGTTSSPITVIRSPDPPISINVTNTILDGTVITWNDPVINGGTPITSYTLASIPSGASFTGSTLSKNIRITNLTVGTTYIFSIISNNSFGSSPKAVSLPFLYVTIPNTVTGVSATAGSASALINWTKVFSSGGSTITNYIITSTPTTTTQIIPSGFSSYSFPGLTNGTSYTFNLVATNSFGPSIPATSNSVIPVSIPNPPTKTRAIPGNTSAIVQWTPPVLTGGLPITGYIVNTVTSGSATVSTTVDDVTYAIITGLTNNISYTFTVNAVNTQGPSINSVASLEVIPLSTLTVPGPPTGLTASASSGSSTPSILVSFTEPSVTGGSRIINYEYSTDGGSTYTPSNPSLAKGPIPITTISSNGITPIINGITYTILIRAINASGIGNASSSVTATPTANIANAPSINSITPGNTTCSVNFTNLFDGGSAITNLSYSINGGSTFTLFNPVQTTSPLTISGLTNGNTYNIALKAINSVGTSTASNISSVTLPATAPAAPTGLSSSNITSSGFSIGFTPGSNQGSAITNYSFSTDNGTTFLEFTPNQTTSPVNITKQSSGQALVASATYSVKIKGINSIGTSAASSSVSVTLSSSGGGGGESLDYPIITNAIYDASGDSIAIYFTPPSGIGEVTNYNYSTDGGEFSALELYPPQTTSPIVIRNLSTFGSINYQIGSVLSPYGISVGVVQDIYLQLIPQTIDTLCKSSNTYKLTIFPSSYNPLSPPSLASKRVNYGTLVIKGYTMPGAPAYGPIRFLMPIKYFSTHVDFKRERAEYGIRSTSLTFSNYQYTTDNGTTWSILSPPQTDIVTIYKNSNNTDISYASNTSIRLRAIDSSGNFDASFNSYDMYTFIPNALSNPPEPPTLLSVDIEFYNRRDQENPVSVANEGEVIIKYTSNDVYNIYPILVYFYIGDSNINLSQKAFSNNMMSIDQGFLVAVKARGGVPSARTFLSYDNGIYTFRCGIWRFPESENDSSINKILAIIGKPFKVKLFALNSSNTFVSSSSLDYSNPSFNNILNTISLPSNSITVSYSSYSPPIRLNYSSTGILIMLPYARLSELGGDPTYQGEYSIQNGNDPNSPSGRNIHRDLEGTFWSYTFFLPFNVGSYKNTILLSLDGGATFTQESVTWTNLGPKLNYTFTEGSTYNLAIKIQFKNVYGTDCQTGVSNSIIFDYGKPVFSYDSKRNNILVLCNGNLNDPKSPATIPDSQRLYMTIDGVETEKTNYVIQRYNETIIFHRGDLEGDIDQTGLYYNNDNFGYWAGNEMDGNIVYNISIRYTYDTSGSFISNTISAFRRIYSSRITNINIYLFYIKRMFYQSNTLYLSIDTTFPSLEFTVIHVFRSESLDLLGDRITTVTPVFSSALRSEHGDKLNVLKLSTGNITPGTPYYFTLKSNQSSISVIDSSGNTRTGNDASGNSLIGCSMPFLFTYYLVPNAPTINGIIKSSSGYASITFTPGSSDAPGGISNYLFSTDYFFTKTVCNVDSNFGNIIIPLTPGTYHIQIQAVSIAGRSASSNSFTFTMT